jgi:hypothetical protein
MLRAVREVYSGVSFDKEKGAFIDTSTLGKTPREKAMIADFDARGINHSIGADDVRAINDRQAGLFGKSAPMMRRALDIAMSNISVVDQANRNAIALAAHRMASNPATMEKMAAPWMEHSAVFRDMAIHEGLTPENFARFMLSEAGGAWGRTNQAPAMRGVEGSLFFTLHGFQTRYLSTAFHLMKNMGPEGKVAAAWMMAGLGLGAGVMGLPFTQDLENAGEALWEKITGTDPMIDAHLRQFMTDAGFGKIGSEILLRGPLSVALGIDLANRIGFGDTLTRALQGSDLMGTIPSIAWGRLTAAWNREQSGQGSAAAGAELLPSALRSPARAAVQAEHGAMSQYGKTVQTPQALTSADLIKTALGFEPLTQAQAYARTEYLSRLGTRDKELRDRTVHTAANLISQAQQAEHAGDTEGAQALSAQMSALLAGYNTAHRQAPVRGDELKDAILQMANPELYQKSRLPRGLRGEAEANPYP